MRPAAIASHAAEAKLGLIVEKKSNRLRKRQRRRVVGKREHASLVAIRSNGSPSLRRRGRKGGDLSFPPFFPRNLVELLSAQAVSKLFRSRRILVGGESRIVPAEIVEPSKSGISRNNRDARRVRGGGRGEREYSPRNFHLPVSNFHAYSTDTCYFRARLLPSCRSSVPALALLSSSFSTLSVETSLFETCSPLNRAK